MMWLKKIVMFGSCLLFCAPGCVDEQTALLNKANSGDAEAQYQMGEMYAAGAGVEQDHKTAFGWYEKSAHQGHAPAENKLGELYESGQGVGQSDSEALIWFQKAGKQKFARGQWNVGRMYETGRGVEQNYEDAERWYERAANQGLVEAECSLGVMYCDERFRNNISRQQRDANKGIRSNDYIRMGREWIKKAADKGFVAAMRTLGNMYYLGPGHNDDAMAALWYGKAAEKGDGEAQFRVGQMSELGDLVPKSLADAAVMWKKSAESGYVPAMSKIGRMYADGQVFVQDPEEAERWFREAAELGGALEQTELAQFLIDHYSDVELRDEAFNLIRRAAEQWQPEALLSLSIIHYEGQAVPKDLLESVKWYIYASYATEWNSPFYHSYNESNVAIRKGLMRYKDLAARMSRHVERLVGESQIVSLVQSGAKAGNARDQMLLGEFHNYRNRFYYASVDPSKLTSQIQPDHEQRLAWLRKAAEQGEPLAQFLVGNFLFSNELLDEKAREEAITWLRKAADHGVVTAQRQFGAYEEKKRRIENTIEKANKGEAETQRNLAHMYAQGVYNSRDLSKGIELYIKAAEQGDSMAAVALGRILSEKPEIETEYGLDHQTVIKWIRTAADSGEADARTRMGEFYEEGDGVEQSFTEALKWYRLAGQSNHREAHFHLAEMYFFGRGVEQDYAEAMRLYQLARTDESNFRLAEMYRQGLGGAADISKAIPLYRKAVKRGHLESTFVLGTLYEKGEGVEQSIANAVSYYKTAAGRGHEGAQAALKRLGK